MYIMGKAVVGNNTKISDKRKEKNQKKVGIYMLHGQSSSIFFVIKALLDSGVPKEMIEQAIKGFLKKEEPEN